MGRVQTENEYDLIVVGGGASGLMVAGRAGERGKKVLLFEKNKRLGEKLRITGGGRCNILNAEPDPRILLKSYGKTEQFLYSLFSEFGMKEAKAFFESRGLPIVVQARSRAFPKSENAEDVAVVLEKYIKAGNVTVRFGSPVTKVHHEDSRITGVTVGGKLHTAREYLFSTGGVSHPETGSTGDGLEWLHELGHTVHKPTPTIVPISVKEEWSKSLAGVSLSFMKITFYVEGKKAFSEMGKVLFTHFGLSGPLILNNAHKVADLLHGGLVTATIDAYPHTDLGALDKQIVKVFDVSKNKTLKNVLNDFIPHGTSRGMAILLSETIDISKKVHSVSREERKAIGHLLKKLPLTVTGLMGFDRAVVADGGVNLAEVDMRTLRSKKVANLFIIGDLLHISRPSGGFSLQLCWSTGYVAGNNIGI